MEEEIKKLAFSYFEGTASPEQEKRLYGLLKDSPEGESAFRQAEAEWKRTRRPSPEVLADLERARRAAGPEKRPRYRWAALAVAAAAVVVALFVLFRPGTPDTGPVPEEQDLVVYALPGSTSRITLPDSTSVCLNSGSVIRYGKDFNRSERRVSLNGEAYFDVIRNPRKPFVVETPECTFTVLGTRFDVCAYEGDDEMYAVLEDGSLKVRTGSMEDVLSPGDKFSKAGSGYTKEKVDVDRYLSWLGGAIKFDKIKFPQLLKRLERAYGISFVQEADGLDDWEIRVSFTEEDSVDSILRTLEEILPVRISRIGKDYHVYNR